MFKRITFSLFAAALVSSAAVYTPKISDSALESAERAPIYTQCQKPGQVAFTFDDGPNLVSTPKVLKFLKEKGIVGTFFINAHNSHDFDTQPEYVELVKKTYNEGHVIASHTYSHADLFEAIPKGTMEKEIDTMTDKIEEIIGYKPAFFRPPKGNGGYEHHESDPAKKEMNRKIQKYLGASGLKIIMWGADTNDWKNKANIDADIASLDKKMRASGVSPENSSFIILMHDIYETTSDQALPRVYDYVKELGYEIVPLTECIGVSSGYQGVDAPVAGNLMANNGTANATTTVAPAQPTTQVEINKDQKSDALAIESKMLFSILAVFFSIFFLY